ncbi:MAG: hypothetical protein H0T73_09720 [Ardenticatenales bacterium]|nr:hypothetical protein [Ardenticatenales bacterium]
MEASQSSVTFTPLEAAVLEMLLRGTEPVLEELRRQLGETDIQSREMTGHGFYLDFTPLAYTEKLHDKFSFVKADFCIGDVEASISFLEYGAGFLLWIRDGLITSLEGYSYEEIWPEEIDNLNLRYFGGEPRDIEHLRHQWQKTN